MTFNQGDGEVSVDRPAFDWVAARATCTAKTLFKELGNVVESDVRSAMDHVCDRFGFDSGPHEGAFGVRLNDEFGKLVGKRMFELVGQEIRVHKGSTETAAFLSGRASLADAKDCLIEVDQRPPMRLWKFSCRALEDFFFAGR